MGKRKSARKPQGPRKREGLATFFTCLFCNHEKSVSVKIDKKAGVGDLDCRICGQKFQCGINYLSAAIDVYSEWVDAADSVAAAGRESQPASTRVARGPHANARMKERDEDERRQYIGDGVVADEYD